MSATADTLRTVLVVDDSVDDVDLLKFAIRRVPRPLRFCFVHDGEAAITYLKGEEPYSDRKNNPFPELVLLDLGLKKMDGFAVLEWIRGTEGCADLKVLIWTGWDIPDHAGRARRLGALQLFLKPTQPDGWEALVSEIFMAVNRRLES